MTRLGDFFKVHGDKFSYKSGPIVKQIFGNLKKHSFLDKHCFDNFFGNFWKHLGNFLLQHLVTLAVTAVTVCAFLQSSIRKFSAWISKKKKISLEWIFALLMFLPTKIPFNLTLSLSFTFLSLSVMTKDPKTGRHSFRLFSVFSNNKR